MNAMKLLGFLVLVCLVSPSSQWTVTNETTLRVGVLSGYDDKVRPQETTQVYMYFQMCSIDAIDIKEQYFKVTGWWFMQWNDSRLTWDEGAHNDIDVLQFYENDIWTPAIVVSNSMLDLSAIDQDTIPARVTNEGTVTWQPPGILTMSCEMDSTYFPFDKQTCYMVVTSFGYCMREVDIFSDKGVKMDYYSENGDWDIKSMGYSRSVYYDGGYPYSKVTFSVTAKRRSTFHWINIIIPILVNTFLCCFVFLLPAESGEKMGYSLTCLLAFVVLLTLLAADMPTSAKHTALLEVYVTLALFMSALSVVLSMFNLHLHFRDDEVYPVGGKTLRLTKFAMFVLGDKRLKKKGSKVHPSYNVRSDRPPSYESNESPTKTPVHRMAPNEAGNDDDEEMEVKWVMVADVMDAVCLRVFFVVTGLLTFIFLLTMVLGDA